MSSLEGLYAAFAEWADRACRSAVPREVVAFSFNLAETTDAFVMELIGAPSFDPDNPDWACDEAFHYREPMFRMPHADIGTRWEAALETGITLTRRYLQDTSHAGERLREASAVAIGFVDGDLHIVWRRAERPQT